MDRTNNDWRFLPKYSDGFEKGLTKYLDKAFSTEAIGDQLACPCKKCGCRYWLYRDVVQDHMICHGFGSKTERQFGAGLDTGTEEDREMVEEGDRMRSGNGIEKNDNLEGLFNDLREGPDEEAKRFFKLVEDGEKELYPGCKKFSKLSFTIRLFVLKCDHKLSNAAFEDILELLGEMVPDAKLPKSFNEAKTVIKVLGLDYTKIDACPNDCMLYWEEHADNTSCHVCGASRWKVTNDDDETGKSHRISAKICRYFPIGKRLQRLHMCPETAKYMTWHAIGRPKDGLMRHPADGESWKEFDRMYPDFAKDPRNVRLGLATDGFSPFNNMGIVHSTWPVILMNYNLPPWIALKPEFFMLALLIPGPLSPGNDIDIYLQPLIKDLQKLWTDGIETYDSLSGKRFDMRVSLMSTVSDFPGYAMLSGWSTKGKTACPSCHYQTSSEKLKFSGKKCYTDHRRFLRANHPYRRNKKKFNGQVEERMPPIPLSGVDIDYLLSDWKNDFGKGRKKRKPEPTVPWRKRPILLNLPYWKHNKCPHNLDVMHIEKNMFDNVLNTLLEVPKKAKDGIKARKDLQELMCCLTYEVENEQMVDMNILDRDSVIKNAKLPYGLASNISRCVKVNERKIQGYKSHDAHFMMQNLLPIAARLTLPEDVAIPLIKLGAFFKSIYRKVIDPEDLDKLQEDIAEILCELEMVFPPAFFDIMEHLPVHLVEEIRLGGPVSQRMMYSIERYLRRLKKNTGNKSHPKGSMAEAQLILECVAFCSRYMKDSSTPVTLAGKKSASFLPQTGYPIKGMGKTRKKARELYRIDFQTWTQVHRYVLFNCDSEEVEEYIKEHKSLTGNQRKRKWSIAQSHCKDFSDWLRQKVQIELHKGYQVHDHVKWLSGGPSYIARRHTGYFTNGYRFHTVRRDSKRVTQNSGVTLTAVTPSFASSRDQNPVLGDVSYYGVIEEIVEIYYHGVSSGVVLFRCVWFHSEIDSYGLTCVNRNKSISKGDPYILASQAHQVFYVEDPTRIGWHFVVEVVPKELFDEEEEHRSSQ